MKILKNILLLLILLNFVVNGFGQTKRPLGNSINDQEEFYKEFRRIELDSINLVNYYNKRWQKLSTKYNKSFYPISLYEINCYFNYIRRENNLNYKRILDSINNNNNNDKLKSLIYYNYARYYFNANEIDSCVVYLDKSFKTIKNKNSDEYIQNLIFKSLLLLKQGEAKKAYISTINASKIFNKSKFNTELYFELLNHEALVLSHMDSINKAISYEHKLLKELEKNESFFPLIKLEAFKNISYFYNDIDDYSTSNYFNEVFKKYGKIISYPYEMSYYGMKTRYFFRIGDLNSALFFNDKEIKEARKRNNKNVEITALGNKATILMYLGDLEKSKAYFERVKEVEEKNGFKIHLAQTLENLSRLNYYLENDKLAHKYFNDAIEIIKNKPYRHSYLGVWYENKSDDYEINGNYKEALKYYKLMKKENDSLFLQSFYKKMAESESKYQTQQKETEILKLSNENLTKEKELTQYKNTLYVSFSFLLFIIGLSFILWNKRKQKQKIALLETTVQATEDEKKRIGKELHDGIASSIIRLVQDVEETDVNLSDKLLKTYHEVRDLSHQLNNTPMHDETLMDRIIEVIPNESSNQSFTLRINPHHLRLKEPYGTHIYRIIQELVANNLKYANASESSIIITLKNEKLIIEYRDNGVGANNITKGSGLKNIDDRVQLMKGKHTIQTDSGFTIKIEIPYKK